MRLIELFRSIKGYIVFCAEGGFSERFINLCMTNRIPIFDTVCSDKIITAKIYVNCFSKLRPIARKTGVRLKIKERRGLPFFIAGYKHRWGLIFSAVFFIVFTALMNSFLWCIDASGSQIYSSEQIIQAAEFAGVKHGVFIPLFDEGAAAREIYRYFNYDLTWVTVNFKGSKCFIEVRDSDKPFKENPESKEPCNLIADFDGVIISDETYSGIKSISKGSAVKKGDLLISGVMENMDMSATYYSAKGKFTALHDCTDTIKVAKDKSINLYSSYKTYYTLHFFGINIPLGADEEKGEDTFSFKKELDFNSEVLPFAFSKVSVAEKSTAKVSQEHNFILACDRFTNEAYDKYKNTKIITSDIKINQSDKEIKLTGKYSCIDFIGIRQPILTENIESK